MPRKKVWPPRPHPHHASGLERVRIDGREIYLGPIGSQEAKANYADLVGKLAAREPVEPPKKQRKGGLTVAEVIERHQADAQARYDPKGREAKQFLYAVDPILDSPLAALPAARFDCARLEEARELMLKRGWSRKVINRRVVRLRTLWRWAERKGLVPPGSWSALRTLESLAANDRRARSTPPKYVPPWGDFARACRHANTVIRDMMLIQLFGGMRCQDVRSMKAGEIDRTAEDWVYRPATHKNAWRGHVREVVLGPRARAVLHKHLEGKRPCDHVFPSGWTRQGASRSYRDDAYPRAVARACERAGVTPFAPSALRHLARVRATRAGSLDHARAMLGHATVDMSAQYAAGVDLKMATEIARKVG